MDGWIKINRGIAEHWIFQDAERFKWWFDLLLMAQWEDKKVLHDSHLFTLKRGQMIVSVSFLCKRWDKSNKTIVNFLHLLEQEGMISRKVVHRQTPILTICNYERYQDNGDTILHTQVHTQVHSIVHTNIRNKEIKEKKDINKLISKKNFIPPDVADVEAYCNERNNTVDPQGFVDFYTSKNWMIGKNKMKDWRAAVRTWEKREQQNNKQLTTQIQRTNEINNTTNQQAEARMERKARCAEQVAELLRTMRPVSGG